MSEAKKLIEVALPLEAINAASAREKSIRHGHPSTLHLWWARRPLAAARAVLFTSLVDDPDDPNAPEEYVEACRALPRAHYAEGQDTPRARLFDFIEQLVKWENSNDEPTLDTARRLIRMCTGDDPPPVYDPFAGGGTIPLEAQRLGLEAHASDLNPVAVLINKAMIEIPPKFAGRPPVNPAVSQDLIAREWKGARGLAEDVRYYGQWMRDEAYRRIGHLYPKVRLPESEGGGEATVIAWLWARTVRSPNPGLQGAQVPLVSSFWLSKKKGHEAWVEPVVDGTNYVFEVRRGSPPDPAWVSGGTKLSRGAHFRCLLSGVPIEPEHVKAEGRAGRLGQRLMAVVAEGARGRVYVSPTPEMEAAANRAEPEWRPDAEMPGNPRWFSPPEYGMQLYGDIFTDRQLVALNTFSDLVGEVREKAQVDAIGAGMPDDGVGIADGGAGAQAYADALATYLAFAVDKLANYNSTICAWHSSREIIVSTFARQAIPMVWDFVEVNPLSDSTGNFLSGVANVRSYLEKAPVAAEASMEMADATTADTDFSDAVVATDPPYYDNIGYADLSDYFYVWMRRSLRELYPDLFGTMLVPKQSELVATPYRFNGSKEQARSFFEDGLSQTFDRLRRVQLPGFPMTVYYAFKQEDVRHDDGGRVSTGWETMLQALIDKGFQIVGTWPVRTEYTGNLKKTVNALASSIVLVCRDRAETAGVTTRAELISELRQALGEAIPELQAANTPPVDIDQSAIGPGMAVYSKYSRVMEGQGTMSVRSALSLINQLIEEVLTGSDADYDSYTRW
ncbi:MAG: DUF1156 domain-containing protein, partial [Spirochaetia bacterium]